MTVARSIRLLAMCCFALSVFPAAGWALQEPKTEEVSGKITWVYDYEQGKLLSRTTQKPMFVVVRCER